MIQLGTHRKSRFGCVAQFWLTVGALCCERPESSYTYRKPVFGVRGRFFGNNPFICNALQ